MTSPQRRLLAPGDRLPAVVLDAVTGKRVDLHSAPGDSLVVVFPHPACSGCADWLDGLDRLGTDLTGWDSLPVAVVTDAGAARALAARVTFPVLLDPGARARSGAGVAPDGASAFVADRWGTVYRSDAIKTDHRVPADDDLRTEVRYNAIQCPECSIPQLSDPDPSEPSPGIAAT